MINKLKVFSFIILFLSIIIFIPKVNALQFTFRDDFNTASTVNMDNTTWNYAGSTCNTNGSVARCQEISGAGVYRGLYYKLQNATYDSNVTIRTRIVATVVPSILGFIFNSQNNSGHGSDSGFKYEWAINYPEDSGTKRQRITYFDGSSENYNKLGTDTYSNYLFREIELTRDNLWNMTYFKIYNDGTTLQQQYIIRSNNLTTGYFGLMIYGAHTNTTIDWVTITYLDTDTDITQNSVGYTTPIAEQTYTSYNLNISINNTKWNLTGATFTYFNESFNSNNLTSGGSYTFNNTLTTPAVTSTTSYTFYWTLNLTNSSGTYLFNTSLYTQQVLAVDNQINVTPVSCSNLYYNFSMIDEENLTKVYGQIDYNIQFGGNGTQGVSYGRLSNTSNLYICFNGTLSSSWVIGQAEFSYISDSYESRKYYLFDNTVATNNTENITLYNILSSRQTSFNLEAKSTSQVPYTNRFTKTLRWYPNLNQYLTVEMGQTDVNGRTVLHLRTEDVDYRIAIYERNGSLIQMDDKTRIACLVNPCTYPLKIIPSASDYTSYQRVDYSWDFNHTTRTFTFIYSDSTGRTNFMNLTVYRDNGLTPLAVCSSSTTGSVGVLTCNTGIYVNGTFRAEVQRSASPYKDFAQKIEYLFSDSSPFTSQFGLFITAVFIIVLVSFFGYISPIFGIVGLVIALILPLQLNVFEYTVFTVIMVIGILVGHLIKRSVQT